MNQYFYLTYGDIKPGCTDSWNNQQFPMNIFCKFLGVAPPSITENVAIATKCISIISIVVILKNSRLVELIIKTK